MNHLFAIILFLKELGNLIRKKEISSLWSKAQYPQTSKGAPDAKVIWEEEMRGEHGVSGHIRTCFLHSLCMMEAQGANLQED